MNDSHDIFCETVLHILPNINIYHSGIYSDYRNYFRIEGGFMVEAGLPLKIPYTEHNTETLGSHTNHLYLCDLQFKL